MGNTTQEVAQLTIDGGNSFANPGALAHSTNAPRKLIWAVLLALTLAMTAVLALPHEAHAVEVGDFEVTGGTSGADYSYNSNVLTIKTGTPLTISMREGVSVTTNDAILVDVGADSTAQVTLQNVKVDVSATEAPEDATGRAAMWVQSGSFELVLRGENSLQSGHHRAGLENRDNTLTISGKGKLAAAGGGLAAGIGSSEYGPGSNITIKDSATVVATGGVSGAGIGGGKGSIGRSGSGSYITIEDSATVVATGGISGAGIGGGSYSSGSNITIKDSATVEATGGNFAAGIGGGVAGSGTDILITGGYVKASAGGIAQPIGHGESNSVASVSITGGAFADKGWSADKVYGIELASGYYLNANNEDASKTDYPVRVYKLGTVVLELKDAMEIEYTKTPVSPSDILKTAKRGGADAAQPVEWSYRLKDSAGDYESDTPTDAGVYEVRAVLPAFIDSGTGVHYPKLTATGMLTVSPKTLTATVNESDPSASKVYDGKATFTGVKLTLSDVIAGDDVVLSPVEGTAASADAGTQSFTASSATLSGVDANNYTLDAATGVTGKITIAPKPLTAKVNESGPSASKVYDGKATFAGVKLTLSDVIAGDDVSAIAEGSAADVKVGSSKAFSASSVSLSGAAVGNYTLDVAKIASGDVAITPKALTATVNESDPSASKVYDGKATFTGVKLTLSDVITGDDVVLSPVEGAAASADAGTQSFTASSATLSGVDAGNYTLAVSDVTGKVTIAPKPLTAKVDSAGPSASKVYDGKATFTGVKLTLSDVIAGDDVSATAEGTVADVKVGSNKAFLASSVSLSGTDAGNYTLAASDVTGTVTIKAAAPTPLPPPDGKDAASGGSALVPTGDTTFGSALVALALAIASAATLAVVRFRRRTN